MNNVELARTLSWRELEIADTELWTKWKGKTHFWGTKKEHFFVCLRCTYDFSNPFLFDYKQPFAVVYNLLSRPFVHYEVVKIVNSPHVNASTKPLVNSSICQLIHSSTHPLIRSSSHPLVNLSIHPLIHSSTHPLIHSSTRPLKLCPLFSIKFNIMSGFFAHQLPFGSKKTILAKVYWVQK